MKAPLVRGSPYICLNKIKRSTIQYKFQILKTVKEGMIKHQVVEKQMFETSWVGECSIPVSYDYKSQLNHLFTPRELNQLDKIIFLIAVTLLLLVSS